MVAFRPATIGMVERVHRLAMPVGNPNVPRTERDALRRRHQEFMGVVGRRGSTITTIGEPL